MELDEAMLEKIVQEVIKRLTKKKNKRRIMVVYTGGRIGFKPGLQQLSRLKAEYEIEFDLLFSKAAERVLPVEEIKDILEVKEAVDWNNAYFQLEEADLVLVPILTQNSASKLALHVTDTLVTDIIFHGIMKGISVVAAQNAADLLATERLKLGMNSAPDILIERNQNYLARLKDYGIEFVSVGGLKKAVEGLIFGGYDNQQQTSNYLQCRLADNNSVSKEVESSEVKSKTEGIINKKVITYGDIRTAAGQGLDEVVVDHDSIITPLAREIAQQKGVEICLQQK